MPKTLLMCFILISFVHLSVNQIHLLVKLQLESNFVAQAACNPKIRFKKMQRDELAYSRQGTNRYSICGETRGDQQCIFDYFWGSMKTWGPRGTRGGLTLVSNLQTLSRTLVGQQGCDLESGGSRL